MVRNASITLRVFKDLTDKQRTTNNMLTELTNQINNQCLIQSTDVIQLTLTWTMTTAQVVDTSVIDCQQQSYSGLHSPR